jgi:hypothetical protein
MRGSGIRNDELANAAARGEEADITAHPGCDSRAILVAEERILVERGIEAIQKEHPR